MNFDVVRLKQSSEDGPLELTNPVEKQQTS